MLGVPAFPRGARLPSLHSGVRPQGMMRRLDRAPEGGLGALSMAGSPLRLAGGGPADIDALIDQAAQQYGVDPALIRRVMQRESAGQAGAVSPAGASGLMQVMPGTYRAMARRYGLGPDRFDPSNNINAGTAYLGQMLRQFQDPRLALAAYNAGPGRVNRALASGPDWMAALPAETQNYVRALTGAGGGGGGAPPPRGAAPPPAGGGGPMPSGLAQMQPPDDGFDDSYDESGDPTAAPTGGGDDQPAADDTPPDDGTAPAPAGAAGRPGLAQAAGAGGMDYTGRPQMQAADRAFDVTMQRIQAAMQAQRQSQNVNLPLLAASAALLRPTRTGSIGESIANAGSAAVPALQQQRAAEWQQTHALSQAELTAAQAYGQRAMRDLSLMQQQRRNDIYEQAVTGRNDRGAAGVAQRQDAVAQRQEAVEIRDARVAAAQRERAFQSAKTAWENANPGHTLPPDIEGQIRTGLLQPNRFPLTPYEVRQQEQRRQAAPAAADAGEGSGQPPPPETPAAELTPADVDHLAGYQMGPGGIPEPPATQAAPAAQAAPAQAAPAQAAPAQAAAPGPSPGTQQLPVQGTPVAPRRPQTVPPGSLWNRDPAGRAAGRVWRSPDGRYFDDQGRPARAQAARAPNG